MSNKVKCINCDEALTWAFPEKVDNFNIEYAKHCLKMIKCTFVCGITMKTKLLNNEQYCKHFKKREGCAYRPLVEQYENMISDFERMHYE